MTVKRRDCIEVPARQYNHRVLVNVVILELFPLDHVDHRISLGPALVAELAPRTGLAANRRTAVPALECELAPAITRQTSARRAADDGARPLVRAFPSARFDARRAHRMAAQRADRMLAANGTLFGALVALAASVTFARAAVAAKESSFAHMCTFLMRARASAESACAANARMAALQRSLARMRADRLGNVGVRARHHHRVAARIGREDLLLHDGAAHPREQGRIARNMTSCARFVATREKGCHFGATLAAIVLAQLRARMLRRTQLWEASARLETLHSSVLAIDGVALQRTRVPTVHACRALQRASAVWSELPKCAGLTEIDEIIGVELATRGQRVDNASIRFEFVEQRWPRVLALARGAHRRCVANDDHAVACPREEDVNALRFLKEPDLAVLVRAHEADDDEIRLLALVIVDRRDAHRLVDPARDDRAELVVDLEVTWRVRMGLLNHYDVTVARAMCGARC